MSLDKYQKSIDFIYKQISNTVYNIIIKMFDNKEDNELSVQIEQCVIKNGATLNALFLDYFKFYHTKNLIPLIHEMQGYEEKIWTTDSFNPNDSIKADYDERYMNVIQNFALNKLKLSVGKEETLQDFSIHLEITNAIDNFIVESIVNPILADFLKKQDSAMDLQSLCKVVRLKYRFKSLRYYSFFVTQLALYRYPLGADQINDLAKGIATDVMRKQLKKLVVSSADILQEKFAIKDNWESLDTATQELYLNKDEYNAMYLLAAMYTDTMYTEHYIVIFRDIVERIKLYLQSEASGKFLKKLLK